MQPIVAESMPQRGRYVWLGAALAATISLFVITRPPASDPVAHGASQLAITRCIEQRVRARKIEAAEAELANIKREQAELQEQLRRVEQRNRGWRL